MKILGSKVGFEGTFGDALSFGDALPFIFGRGVGVD